MDFDPDFRDWTDALGRHTFRFAALLSHNRFDQSDNVVLELQRRGVSVWHDAHANMLDRQVRAKVHRAVRASRYVVVCIGSGFRASPWVRAEYRPALAVEQPGKLTRLVVLRMDRDALVPEELAGSPRFDLDDLDNLSSFLLKGNLLPFEPTAVFASARAHLNEVLALPDASTSMKRGVDEEETLARLLDLLGMSGAKLEEKAEGAEFYHWGFSIRNWMGQSLQSLPPYLSKEGVVLRRFAVRLTGSPNTDNRANGIMLQGAIDERWGVQILSPIYWLACALSETPRSSTRPPGGCPAFSSG